MGIYDSDTVMDYIDTIENRIKREIEYWMTPEQVAPNGWWLAQVLAVIEIILLFEQHKVGLGGITIESETTVQRWRKTFMPIWDSEWKADTNYPVALDTFTYRQQHRPAIEAMFNHLETTTYSWKDRTDSNSDPESTPLLPDYPLPYFSIRRESHNDRETVTVERFTNDLIEQLVKDIIYWLSPEKRGETIAFFVAREEIPAAAETLGFICEIYEQDLGVNEQIVCNWRDITLERIRESDNDMTISWEATIDEQYKIIKATFDRLETVAHKYPPENFWDE
ncbi:MAG: hypothetical protein H0X30_15185 [Anaerolineae bacterium]|nr:hypothetical protein [Anaerolineae bacterium]